MKDPGVTNALLTGRCVLTIVLLAMPVFADTIVLTLDEETVPAGIQCGETWNEAGLNLTMLPHPPLCLSVEACDFFSAPDYLAFSPAILEVDLAGIAGTVTCAVVFAGSLCTCVNAVFYDGTAVVDNAWGGGFQDTLEVFTSGLPVDRLAIEGCYSTTVDEIHIEFDPTATGIGQAVDPSAVPFEVRPNPFDATTRISFELETGGRVQLRIYDVAGRAVRSVVDAELRAGRRTVAWDGRDTTGRRLASGTYFAQLVLDGRIAASRKVVIAR